MIDNQMTFEDGRRLGYAEYGHRGGQPWGIALRDITTPIHIWHGDHDTTISLQNRRTFKAWLPLLMWSYLIRKSQNLKPQQKLPVS
ncbi:MAG: hypothetical protein ACO1OC_02790 [Tuberibacillus sp.]